MSFYLTLVIVKLAGLVSASRRNPLISLSHVNTVWRFKSGAVRQCKSRAPFVVGGSLSHSLYPSRLASSSLKLSDTLSLSLASGSRATIEFLLLFSFNCETHTYYLTGKLTLYIWFWCWGLICYILQILGFNLLLSKFWDLICYTPQTIGFKM